MEKRRGLNITRYDEEDIFSMSSICINFNSSDQEKIDNTIMHAIGRILYNMIIKSDYYKEGWFSSYMVDEESGEISFCLTPAVSEEKALRYVQILFLGLLGLNLRTKEIIDAIGVENLPKMESELEQAKKIVWSLLGDITMRGKVYSEKE